MFGESESESPRIPSPWDTLMSTPPTSNSATGRAGSIPSPLALELVPKLVPESDDGNVEYKLQLLDPSPGRFARLVTQLKWRLLEGGGQAYYELGVADSGDLIGLSRDEIEKSLETLEMMAGEIGASVIVVKEIEVPAGLATLARSSKEGEGVSDKHGTPSSLSSTDGGYSSSTSVTDPEIETDWDSLSGTDVEECLDLQKTVILSKGFSQDETSGPVFMMDSETDEEGPTCLLARFDVEICSVFKPRPVKARGLNPLYGTHLFGGKNKRNKKFKPGVGAVRNSGTKQESQVDKALQRRQDRDRRREEKRKARTGLGVDGNSGSPERDALVDGLKMLHVGVVEELHGIEEGQVDVVDEDDDNDLFTGKTGLCSLRPFSTSESYLDVDPAAIAEAVGVKSNDDVKWHKTLIVEALVVRKMSHQEAFLDFEGFSVC